MNHKKYIAWQCKDCDIDYYVWSKAKKAEYCPSCGDNIYTEKIRDIYLKRPIHYNKHWTDEEKEILKTGLRFNKTKQEISEELEGRTEGAVASQMLRLRRKGELI